MNDWWEYDIENNSWEQKARYPSYQRHHPYQFAAGEYVYAGLGHGDSVYNDWAKYDPKTDTWTQAAALPDQARVAGTQFSYNGKGYVLSGQGETHRSMKAGEFWKYDPVADQWEQLPSHPGESRWALASFIINHEVYLINGVEGNGSLTFFQKYRLE